MGRWPVVLVVGCLACAQDGGPLPAPEGVPGTAVRMDFSRAEGLYGAPFPSDDLLGDTGPMLAEYPNPDGIDYVARVIDILAEARGFGTTMGVFFAFDGPLGPVDPDPRASLSEGSPLFLVAVTGPERGERIPVIPRFDVDPGPFGAPNLLALLPLQGMPLSPGTTYAAVVTRDLLDADGAPLGVSADMAALAAGRAPSALRGEARARYAEALATVRELGTPPDRVSGLAVFTTWDPVTDLAQAVSAARGEGIAQVSTPARTDVFDAYCVYEGTLSMPVYQEGTPPYDEGGGWIPGPDGAPLLQGRAEGRWWLTVPRAEPPAAGWPTAVMVRTGGGGDRPLVDRGRHDESGETVVPGEGPALYFARAGMAGFMVDGPHGGPRNVTGADEQFLMFNFANPVATRDNVRQSALELALVPDLLAGLEVDVADCPDAGPRFAADPAHLAILGHSMGATIAPLVLAAEPRFGATVLSGAGGSYIHNLVYKESPIPVRPLAEAMVGYFARGRELHEHDPFLSLLQWAAEPADPPPYARVARGAHALVLQGIVDTYILPPMANATTLSFALDLGGPELDRGHPELERFAPAGDLVGLAGGSLVELPAGPTRGDRTAMVSQHAEDGLEDGHEVMFQTDGAKHQYQCFLADFAAGLVPVVPDGGRPGDPCP